MPASSTKWGRNGEERAALLRVRTRPKGPESNGRELLQDSILNCEIAREREKINRPEHTAGCSQNKGTEKLQRRTSLQRTGPSPLESEGRGEEKGANLAPEKAPLPHCKQASSF